MWGEFYAILHFVVSTIEEAYLHCITHAQIMIVILGMDNASYNFWIVALLFTLKKSFNLDLLRI